MTDRRRVNGPSGGTARPVFTSTETLSNIFQDRKRDHSRRPDELRKIFIKTGLIPSASGSAYLECEVSPVFFAEGVSFVGRESAVKLSCTVFGPRPLPRSAPFTPQLLLSTYVKMAPFATRQRRNYMRGATERDLSTHLETALRGIIIGERWPKSGVELVVTVLEDEEDSPLSEKTTQADGSKNLNGSWGVMSILSGCITVASAALVDAGIDCIDLVCGGMAAVVQQHPSTPSRGRLTSSAMNDASSTNSLIVLNPHPSEHQDLIAGCVVGYLPSRDEVTELWAKGDGLGSIDSPILGQTGLEFLINQAIEAAKTVRLVLTESINASTELRLRRLRNSDDLNINV